MCEPQPTATEEPSANNFENLFSFFTPNATVWGKDRDSTQNSRISRCCHDTHRIFSVNTRHTHYNYCHLVVCCSELVTVTNPLVSLSGGAA